MKRLLYIICVVFIAQSCETPIDPKLPENGSDVVVYSFYRPDSRIQMDVFNAIPILDVNSFQRLENLEVRLNVNGDFVEVLSEENGSYISSILPEEGDTFSFELMSEDGLVSASSYIPESVEILDATLSRELVDINIGEYGYPAEVTFQDPLGVTNYYSLEVFVEECSAGCSDQAIEGELNEVLIEDLDVDTGGTTDVIIGGGPEAIDGFRYLYFEDDSFDGEVFTFNFFIIPTLLNFDRSDDVKVRFVLKSLTKEYFDYLLTSDYQLTLEEEGSLSEPVQISTNINNGMGVFAGYNYNVYSLQP